jgi:NAD(P)-dependent dehydrogenase (short-subunit alcohol dehydrogenase family)
VCRALSAQGARVALTYRTGEASATSLAAELPDAIALPLDLASVPDIESTVEHASERLGGLDVLIQCAGIAITGESGGPVHQRMEDVDEPGWTRMLDINAKSTFFAVRKASEVMRRGAGGNMVLVGSVDSVKPVPTPVHYATSKGALRGMTAAMAKELGEFNIRINMVAPGILEGGLSRALPEDLVREYVKHCGLKRVGRLEEIAGVIAWLALENSYATGQAFLVDGAL